MRRIIIKEGPVVFLRNVLYMEILASIFFFSISFITDYSIIYNNFGLSKLIRFDIFEILIFSIFQLFYISSLFLNWYFRLRSLRPLV